MKGNVESKFFIYLAKAKLELQAMNELAESKGLVLRECLDVSTIALKIDNAIRLLAIGYTDSQYSFAISQMDKETVNCIVKAIAEMNALMNCFDEIGVNVDGDSFNGHLYGTISSLSKSLDFLCGIDSNDDDAHLPIDTVSMANWSNVANSLSVRYMMEIHDNIKEVVENW